MRLTALRGLSLLVGVWLAGLAELAAGQIITEFPTYFHPNAIASGSDSLYFTTLDSRNIGRTGADGSVTAFLLTLTPCNLYPLSGSDTITFGADRSLWITPECGTSIGEEPPPAGAVVARLTTNGGLLSRTLLGLLATDAVLGPDGNMWLSGYPVGVSPMGGIWRLTNDLVATRFGIPSPSQAAAMGLAVGPDGKIWFTAEGDARIGNISTTGAVTLFDLPSSDRRPFYIASGPDGNLWFTEASVDGSKSWIGRITVSGVVTEFPLSTPSPLGFARIVTGQDGNLWFTEPGFPTEPLGKIGRITPAGVISEFATPTANSGPTGLAAGPDGNIWFTEPSKQKIGRITTGGASCATDTQTLCLNNGRFSVTATFQRTPEGPSSAASAIPLTGDTGYFWFFEPTNIEVVAKVLTGCSVDDNYWVFAGGLTDVGVEMKVTDTLMNAVKTYSNVFGTPFQPIQDSSAFPCP